MNIYIVVLLLNKVVSWSFPVFKNHFIVKRDRVGNYIEERRRKKNYLYAQFNLTP